MKKRHALLLVLATNLALIVASALWLTDNEPYPLHIDGEAYDQSTEPFIAPKAVYTGPQPDTPAARLVLIGDAGDPPETNTENLKAFREWNHRHRGITTTLLLGDNVYPRGFREDEIEQAEANLSAQLEAAGARALVIPGNHDWGDIEGMFPERVLRQQAFVDAWPGAEFMPRNACPGPQVTELIPESILGRAVTLIAVDTQWLLSPIERPDCGTAQHEVMQQLIALLEEHDDDLVILASHHPIRSGGPHGGFQRDFFRRWWQAVFGSQGTFGKPLFVSIMDDYGKAMRKHRPLLYTAGHEHSLQLIADKDRAEYLLVSGAGAVDHVNTVTPFDDSLFAHAYPGFTVIDFYPGGDQPLALLRMIEAGKGEVFVTRLTLP